MFEKDRDKLNAPVASLSLTCTCTLRQLERVWVCTHSRITQICLPSVLACPMKPMKECHDCCWCPAPSPAQGKTCSCFHVDTLHVLVITWFSETTPSHLTATQAVTDETASPCTTRCIEVLQEQDQQINAAQQQLTPYSSALTHVWHAVSMVQGPSSRLAANASPSGVGQLSTAMHPHHPHLSLTLSHLVGQLQQQQAQLEQLCAHMQHAARSAPNSNASTVSAHCFCCGDQCGRCCTQDNR